MTVPGRPGPDFDPRDVRRVTITAAPALGGVPLEISQDRIYDEPSRHMDADGHVDPAAAARWHQAQTELVGLIREEHRTVGLDQPEAGRRELLPDSLGDWMARRACELEEAEADAPEIEAIG